MAADRARSSGKHLQTLPVDGVFNNRERWPPKESLYVLNPTYGSPIVHIDGSDICNAHASGINLPTRMVVVWHRSKAKADRLLGKPTGAREPTHRFPHEIVEMIVAQLIRELSALMACSLTCRSWYIAAAPHLHHTLTLREGRYSSGRDKLKPLSKLDGLGLMPLVREIRVEQSGMGSWFIPQALNPPDLRYFSAFTNVHTLRLQGMEIDRFIPKIERCFGHFSPTLRSITLVKSRCTPQQLAHFLSLFSNLDNVELQHAIIIIPTSEPRNLVPFSAPPPKLRGRLVLYDFHWVETWTHLVALCGGLRFRHIDLCKEASCAPVLLEACAGTLETLRFNATYSESFCAGPSSGWS